jgi:F-type H+-transporting ATPase subunit alpha
MSVAQMSLVLYAVEKHYVDDVAIDKIAAFGYTLTVFAKDKYKTDLDTIDAKPELTSENETILKNIIEDFKATQTW